MKRPTRLVPLLALLSLPALIFATRAPAAETTVRTANANVEAPAAFDNKTNDFISQAEFDANRAVFEEEEGIEEGLGPIFNHTSCRNCHLNPVTGGPSQIFELRAGHFNGTNFIPHPGGDLIQENAINAAIQERILEGNEVRTFRTSTNILGDGFVEAVANETLLAIRSAQPSSMRGTALQVEMFEAPGRTRVGRFGWKDQHASLLSFSATAYLAEMGITSPFQPAELTSNGRSVAAFDPVPDPEDDGDDVEAFAAFMRATKAPPPDATLAATTDAINGRTRFGAIGCAVCHVASIVTSPPGNVINGGTFTVPPALGNKTIHPYSDFLLHNVGTGDGIVQTTALPETLPQFTRNIMRTGPLWGVRTHTRLMHDGRAFTFNEAILDHAGQATEVINRYRALSSSQKREIVRFLESL
jgi:CxxC motif-containing protein (DUF1111 family)